MPKSGSIPSQIDRLSTRAIAERIISAVTVKPWVASHCPMNLVLPLSAQGDGRAADQMAPQPSSPEILRDTK